MKRLLFTSAILSIFLLGACRSRRCHVVADAARPPTAEERWQERIEDLRQRGFHPITISFIDSLWEAPLPARIRSLPSVETLPADLLLESVAFSEQPFPPCGLYAFTVHIDPQDRRYWITRQGGIAGWIEHFGPGDID